MLAHRPTLILFMASLASFLMLAQVLAGKTARDALFLSNFPASVLPYAIAGGGLIALLTALPVSRAFGRYGPARVLPWLFILSALLFALEWGLAASLPRLTSGLLYLHLAAANAVLISGFWAMMNEQFDPYSAKRALSRLAAYATAGGLVGGLLAEQVSSVFGLVSTLLMLGGMHGICAILIGPIAGSGPREDSCERAGATSSFRTFTGMPYLRLMLLAGLLLAMVDALLDYAIKVEASRAYPTGEDLARFFGFFYTGVGFMTLLLQVGLAPRVLARFGIGTAMMSLPASLGLAGLVSVFSPGLIGTIVLRSSASAFSNSFFRTGFELLYTPLPIRVKRASKTFVDVAGQRAGDILGGGLLLLLLSWTALEAVPIVVGVSVALALVLIPVLRRLQKSYREQLLTNLQSGEVSLEEMDTLARSVAETRVRMDRAQILAQIHETRVRASSSEASEMRESADPLVEECIQRLSDPGQAAGAQVQLRAMGVSASDALCTALLDPDYSQMGQLLIPELLEKLETSAAVKALVDALAAPRFEVRLRCGRALARLAQAKPELLFEHDPWRPLREELAHPDQSLDQVQTDVQDRLESPLLSDHPNLRVDRRLEHVFTLISLALDPSLVRTVLLALHSQGGQVRGTAAEYLEVSLPDDLARACLELAGLSPPPESRRARAAQQVEADLLRAAQAKVLDGADGSSSSGGGGVA